jgi:hypothetical protein
MNVLTIKQRQQCFGHLHASREPSTREEKEQVPKHN